ncbi:hypothetical protein [Agromyces sp. M3QZ16-3]|uniref:hypothetical protein n=1 Tax=Agromyces sp. M3QZ16-3 TaxID=3447585 RepID=UPI003F694B75
MTAPLPAPDGATAVEPPPAARLDRVEELQARIRGMQATRLDTRALPTHPALASVLPGGALREGAIVQVEGSITLLMAALAGPSRSGRWVAVSGMPEFGVEAAARFGIDLERLVLVPDPGRQWLTVAAALADVIPVVAVRPTARLAPAEASRFAARLRQRGALLLVDGDWPGSDARLELERSDWTGLERGHGHLVEREVVVRVTGRGEVGRGARRRLRLPAGDLGFSAVDETEAPAAIRAIGADGARPDEALRAPDPGEAEVAAAASAHGVVHRPEFTARAS